MPKKAVRFKSAHEIRAKIFQCERDANTALKEADEADAKASQFFRAGLSDDGKYWREEAAKLRRRADRLLDSTAHKLGEKLSEFETAPMPFLEDPSVQGL